MLKYYNYDIVFSEIPDEITLAVNLTNCPNRCEGCHSPWLQKNCGDILDEKRIYEFLERYGNHITCFCFMGGDKEPAEVARLATFIHNIAPTIKTGWYSGCNLSPEEISKKSFDYVKTGSFMRQLGGLSSRSTNQRLYSIDTNGKMTDLTYRFWRKEQIVEKVELAIV